MHEHDHNMGLFGGEIHYSNAFQFGAEIFKHALVITVFVIIMMLLIEYLTVQSRGRWYNKFEKYPFLQILTAALLGLTPGCLGVYIVVSLYVHRIFHFAALSAAMIATSGDEAFVKFAMIPWPGHDDYGRAVSCWQVPSRRTDMAPFPCSLKQGKIFCA